MVYLQLMRYNARTMEKESRVDTLRLLERKTKQKTYFLKRLFSEEPSQPGTDEGRKMIQNALIISNNRMRLENSMPDFVGELRHVLHSAKDQDQFAYDDYGKRLAETMLQDTKDIDPIDLILATQATDYFLIPLVGDTKSPNFQRVGSRYHELTDAYIQHFAAQVDVSTIVQTDSLPQLHAKIFPDQKSPESITIAEHVLNDRYLLEANIHSNFIDDDAKAKRYNNPLKDGEKRQINTVAADTIEQLHLLKAYPITAFEIKGDTVGLPWDVNIVAPLKELKAGEVPERAEGAIADFLFTDPQEEKRSTNLEINHVDENTKITMGGAPTIMRFRLHDNGQISHGLYYHNIPSDVTEKYFKERHADDAFVRLRGLFIAIAFDAMVPYEVTTGPDVDGSVGSTFQRSKRNESSERTITELLLSRRRALRKTGVNEHQRQPKGWDAPKTQDVKGYFKQLLPGTRARSTAEEDARKYHEDNGLPFPGLPEGTTWVDGYKRSSSKEVTYRQAKFRKGSATDIFTRKNSS